MAEEYQINPFDREILEIMRGLREQQYVFNDKLVKFHPNEVDEIQKKLKINCPQVFKGLSSLYGLYSVSEDEKFAGVRIRAVLFTPNDIAFKDIFASIYLHPLDIYKHVLRGSRASFGSIFTNVDKKYKLTWKILSDAGGLFSEKMANGGVRMNTEFINFRGIQNFVIVSRLPQAVKIKQSLFEMVDYIVNHGKIDLQSIVDNLKIDRKNEKTADAKLIGLTDIYQQAGPPRPHKRLQ
eukprot:122401_1